MKYNVHSAAPMRKRRRFGARVFAGIAVVLLCGSFAYACVESSTSTTSGNASSSGSGGGNFDRNTLLTSITDNVVLVALDDFWLKAQALEAAAAAFATSSSDTDKEAAKQAWRAAMLSWQHVELMQLGPAGSATEVAGGADFRDEIYSWPIVNRCRVDQETVEENYNNSTAFVAEPVNVRGLDALEYLLFNDSAANACPPQNVINTAGGWDAIAGQLPAHRAAYAATLAKLVAVEAQALRAAWSQGFADELRNAGQGASSYPSAHAALNAVSDAMFYIESETKDVKLAAPVGLSDCDVMVCPDKLEFALSQASKGAIEHNLLAFESMFYGGPPDQEDAVGFDDWLVALGAGELATEMGDAIVVAKGALAAIEEDDLAVALADDRESVEALYFAIKGVTDKFKVDVVTVLDLDLPNKVQGDND